MARKMSLEQLEDQLLCPICLEVFRDPLMLRCGHSYCQPCVASLSGGPEPGFLCPVCRQSNDGASSPPNVSLARVVEALRGAGGGGGGGEEGDEGNEGDDEGASCPEHRNPLSLFCEGDRAVICGLCGTIGSHRHHRVTPLSTVYSRMKEELSALMTEVQQQQRDLEEHLGKLMNNKTRIANESDVFKWVVRKQFQALHRFVDEEKARFLGRLERQVSGLEAGLETQVQQAEEALRGMKALEDRLRGLNDEGQRGFVRKYGSFPSRSELTHRHPPEGGAFTPVSFRPDFHQDDVQMMVWKRLLPKILPAPEALALDPSTAAHPALELSKGGTVVRWARPAASSLRRGSLPGGERGAEGSAWVLASRGFSWGRHYWEVVVGARGQWRLGLVKASALGLLRRGRLPKSPEQGAWLLGLKEGRGLEAFAGPRVALPPGPPPRRLGLFLHYEKGELTFFDATQGPRELAPLYTFRGGFQGTLFPVLDLGPWSERGGASALPIVLPTPAMIRQHWEGEGEGAEEAPEGEPTKL